MKSTKFSLTGGRGIPAVGVRNRVIMRPKKMKNFIVRTGEGALPRSLKPQPIVSRVFRYIVQNLTPPATTEVEFNSDQFFYMIMAGAAVNNGNTQYTTPLLEGAKLREVRVYGMANDTTDDNPLRFTWMPGLNAEPDSTVVTGTRAFPSCIVARPPEHTNASWWWGVQSLSAGSVGLFAISGLANGDIIDIELEYVPAGGAPPTTPISTTSQAANGGGTFAWASANVATGVVYGRLADNVLPYGLVTTTNTYPSSFTAFP